MPRPVQNSLSAAIFLLAVVALPSTAHAEITEADKEGMRAFTACLDEADGGESVCIETLGRHAWYPRDDATCEAISGRVETVIELDGVPKYRDMFMNERCARLDLPHNRTAAAAGIARIGDKPYYICGETVFVDVPYCDTGAGRYLWHPGGKRRNCRTPMRALEEDLAGVRYMNWSILFKTERCHRLGEEYFQPEKKR